VVVVVTFFPASACGVWVLVVFGIRRAAAVEVVVAVMVELLKK